MTEAYSGVQEETQDSGLIVDASAAQLPAVYYRFTMQEGILHGRLAETTLPTSIGLARIRSRRPHVRRRALQIQEEYGDPIQNLADTLGSMPGSEQDWDALIDASY